MQWGKDKTLSDSSMIGKLFGEAETSSDNKGLPADLLHFTDGL